MKQEDTDGKKDRVLDVARYVIERNKGSYDDSLLGEVPDRLLGMLVTDANIGLAVREIDVMRFEREKKEDARSKTVVKFLFNVAATISRW